jgi:asparagine synthase (glutamine-hydrolysing)
LPEVFARSVNQPPMGDAEATDALEALLQDAVERRMMADVPLGAFLSGGIDSSLVAALMQRASERPVRTFSIGFEEADYDESHHAAAVAAHLGTDHTQLRVRAQDALEVVPRLPEIFDEPFADSSQIPTFLVSQLTRQHVTVALSGDGGDELFAGYSRYTTGARLWDRLGGLPGPIRHAAASLIDAVPPGAWSAACRLLPQSKRPFAPGDRFAKVARLLRADSLDGVHLALAAQGARLPLTAGRRAAFSPVGGVDLADLPVAEGVRRMQAIDLLTYLPCDILTKVDRTSMAVALEARVPLLDHRVVEFAAALPPEQKIRGGQGKWLLRQVLYRHVPEGLFNRPKQGFAAPIAEWLRGALRPWAEELIATPSSDLDAILDHAALREMWGQHQSGTRNHTGSLWAALMLLAWAR